MIPAKHAGVSWQGTQRLTSGDLIPIKKTIQKDTKCRGTVWNFDSSNSERNRIKLKHPGTFPDALARDHIHTWTQEGDTVFDPLAGSGTVGIEASKANRNSYLIELDEGYCEIIKERYHGETNARVDYQKFQS
jgi:DNA modification methylase